MSTVGNKQKEAYLNTPDLLGVSLDTPVRRELATAGGGEDGHLGPAALVTVGSVDSLLGIEV